MGDETVVVWNLFDQCPQLPSRLSYLFRFSSGKDTDSDRCTIAVSTDHTLMAWSEAPSYEDMPYTSSAGMMKVDLCTQQLKCGRCNTCSSHEYIYIAQVRWQLMMNS